MQDSSPANSLLLPARRSAGAAKFFNWWIGRMLRTSFCAVRLAHENGGLLRSLNDHAGPAIVVMNHSSWWDPLIGIRLAQTFTPGRAMLAPIELAMLRKFGIFRKVGFFGIEPDRPESFAAMLDYVRDEFTRGERATLWITPQGQFADVREPVRIRPGAAAVAARTPNVRVVSIACEMPFWIDRRPELLLRLEPCEAESSNTPGWTRAITAAMQRNADAMAVLARSRDASKFGTLIGGAAGRVNPMYDLWLRLRGKRPGIEARDRGMTNQPMAESKPMQPGAATEKSA